MKDSYASGIFFLSSLKSTSDHMKVLNEPGNWRPCIFPATYSNFLGSLCKMAWTARPMRSLWGPQRGGGSPSTLWIMPKNIHENEVKLLIHVHVYLIHFYVIRLKVSKRIYNKTFLWKIKGTTVQLILNQAQQKFDTNSWHQIFC